MRGSKLYIGIMNGSAKFLCLAMLVTAIAFTACSGITGQTSPSPGRGMYTLGQLPADPGVKERVQLLDDSFVASNGRPAGANGIGYLGAPGNYTEVRISENDLSDYVTATIDTDSRQVVALVYGDFRTAHYGNMMIPPMSYAYLALSPWLPIYHVKTDFTPGNATICQIVLNRSEFQDFVNRSAFLPEYATADGSIQAQSGQITNVTLWTTDATKGSTTCFLVWNGGDRPVTVSIDLFIR